MGRTRPNKTDISADLGSKSCKNCESGQIEWLACVDSNRDSWGASSRLSFPNVRCKCSGLVRVQPSDVKEKEIAWRFCLK